MNKTNLLFLVLALFLVFASVSCEEDHSPRAVITVVEMVDSVLVPVSRAFVEIRPATNEEVLEKDENDDGYVTDKGYTNSSGTIEFVFDKKLVLRAEASKYKTDESGAFVLDVNGNPIVIKKNYKTIVLDYDYTDHKTIEVK